MGCMFLNAHVLMSCLYVHVLIARDCTFLYVRVLMPYLHVHVLIARGCMFLYAHVLMSYLHVHMLIARGCMFLFAHVLMSYLHVHVLIARGCMFLFAHVLTSYLRVHVLIARGCMFLYAHVLLLSYVAHAVQVLPTALQSVMFGSGSRSFELCKHPGLTLMPVYQEMDATLNIVWFRLPPFAGAAHIQRWWPGRVCAFYSSVQSAVWASHYPQVLFAYSSTAVG